MWGADDKGSSPVSPIVVLRRHGKPTAEEKVMVRERANRLAVELGYVKWRLQEPKDMDHYHVYIKAITTPRK